MDRWKSVSISCTGGLVLNVDTQLQGRDMPGSARTLQNFESAIEGGYKKILGYSEFDSNALAGSGAILGVAVGLGKVYACRLSGSTYDIYGSSGSGWGSRINPNRTGVVTKLRGIRCAITVPAMIFVDGANPAGKWDGTTWTTINGSGAPTDPKYAAVFRNRLVLAGYSADTQEISISEPASDTGFVGASGAAAIPCTDIITGLRTFREELYIFCQNSIKKLTGSTSSDFAVVDVSNTIGCVSHDSIQEIGGDLIFLSPDGLRSLAATVRVNDLELGLVSQAIQPTLRAEVLRQFDEYEYSSCIIRAKNQYRLMIYNSGVTSANQIGFIGRLDPNRSSGDALLAYQWSTTMGIQPYCADSAYQNNQEYAVFGHPSDGKVYRLEQGSSFSGSDIPAIYRSPDIILEDEAIRKVFQKSIIHTQIEGDIAVSLQIHLDADGTNIPQPAPQSLSQTGSTPVYGTAVYGTSTYGALTYPIFKKNLVGSGTLIAFEFTSTDQNASYRIDSFNIIYAPKSFR